MDIGHRYVQVLVFLRCDTFHGENQIRGQRQQCLAWFLQSQVIHKMNFTVDFVHVQRTQSVIRLVGNRIVDMVFNISFNWHFWLVFVLLLTLTVHLPKRHTFLLHLYNFTSLLPQPYNNLALCLISSSTEVSFLWFFVCVCVWFQRSWREQPRFTLAWCCKKWNSSNTSIVTPSSVTVCCSMHRVWSLRILVDLACHHRQVIQSWSSWFQSEF